MSVVSPSPASFAVKPNTMTPSSVTIAPKPARKPSFSPDGNGLAKSNIVSAATLKPMIAPSGALSLEPVKSSDTSTVKSGLTPAGELAVRLDEKLKLLDLSVNAEENDKLSADSPEFGKKLFDAAFNTGRRLGVTMNDTPLDQWRTNYDKNYEAIEKEVEKIRQLPPEEQKAIYHALRIGTVAAPLNPKRYRDILNDVLSGKQSGEKFLTEQANLWKEMVESKEKLEKDKFFNQARELHKNGLVTSDDFVKFIIGRMSPDREENFKAHVSRLYSITNDSPESEKPRVIVFWNGREGKIGAENDPNVSRENGTLTDKLRGYWRRKGCEVLTVDGSGGTSCRDLNISNLFKLTQASGFITGGGPDPNAHDPFVRNFKKILDYADSKKIPYFGECLGHQIIGMLKSGYDDYKSYVGTLKDRASHSPGDISQLDTRQMEKDYALYRGDLRRVLRDREKKTATGQKNDPVRVFCIHNNILNDAKPLVPRVWVGARSADAEKAPEVLVAQDDKGFRDVISTQFHPSELTKDSPYLENLEDGNGHGNGGKVEGQDEDFGLAVLNASIQKMKDFHKANRI